MIVTELKAKVLSMVSGHQVMIDQYFIQRANNALTAIVREAMPMGHIVIDEAEYLTTDGENLFRRPIELKTETDEVDMEAELLDAVGYHILSTLDETNGQRYKAKYWSEVGLYRDEQIRRMVKGL